MVESHHYAVSLVGSGNRGGRCGVGMGMKTGWSIVSALIAVVLAGCGAAVDPGVSPAAADAGRRDDVPDSCPLTIPPRPGLVPPEPYPAEPPSLYQAVWYGTPALWTMLDPSGEVWDGLPRDQHGFGQKILYWSAGYSWRDELTPAITVTGRRLDGPGSLETEGSGAFGAGDPGTNGFREDINSFMLVGLAIPTAGCWELTAQYKTAELTHVVWVED